MNSHDRLPRSGPQREWLREKGQFWTPDWVAEAMVSYVVGGGSKELFDPAVGEGAFFRAAKTVAAELDRKLTLVGTEIDEQVLIRARNNGLTESDLHSVSITDFVVCPPKRSFKAIIANPPYIRHHRLPVNYKQKLREFGAKLTGKLLDGRAGVHVYFLLRALQLLENNGRLAFIMPADTCEGLFANDLWNWITRDYCLDAVITFAPDASPFPGVDTNPLIFMIRKTSPCDVFWWVRCNRGNTEALKKLVRADFKWKNDEELSVCRRKLAEGLATGLSRSPIERSGSFITLRSFARVMRGIATGGNEFFFMTAKKADSLGIPAQFLTPAIGRTRDVPGDLLAGPMFHELEAKSRPTLLFAPDGRTLDRFPSRVREYLEHGQTMGLHTRPLIRTREPWYKMEKRPIPPILFAYLGRRNARFIRNLAGVVPLTGFLCVYPHQTDSSFVDKVWEILKHPQTIANLPLVGKSYGAGAIKVEPRALEKLPIPTSVVAEVGLNVQRDIPQLGLFLDQWQLVATD